MATSPKPKKPAQRPACDVLANLFDPMSPVTAQQANTYLLPPRPNLDHAEEGEEDFIPYEPKGRRDRIFRLGDILTAQSGDPDQRLKGSALWSREDVEQALAKRIGPPPTWLDLNDYEYEAKKVQSDKGWEIVAAQLGSLPTHGRRSAGRPKSVIPPLMGGRIHRITFSSLGDFVHNAYPDDIWIVAKPMGRRPYDFLDSLADQDGAPWQTMTLIEYLDAIRSGAQHDRGAQNASTEARKLRRITKKPR